MKPLDSNWQTIGCAALRAALEARRRMQAEKLFGPVPTNEDLQRIYAKESIPAHAGEG